MNIGHVAAGIAPFAERGAAPGRGNLGQRPNPQMPPIARNGRRPEASEAQTTAVQFQFDEDLKRVIARVIREQTGKVVRQIPDEDIVAMAKTLRVVSGQLFDRRI